MPEQHTQHVQDGVDPSTHTHTPKKIVGRFAGRKGALRPEAEVDEANRFFQLDLV